LFRFCFDAQDVKCNQQKSLKIINITAPKPHPSVAVPQRKQRIVPVVASFTFFFRKHVEVFESHQFLVLKNNGSSDSIENRKTMH